MPANGSQDGMQSANSLPPGFENGTPPYEQARSVQRYPTQQQAGQVRQVYVLSPQPARTGTHG
jgi:hypothetical protein